jgi:hypothetical protein
MPRQVGLCMMSESSSAARQCRHKSAFQCLVPCQYACACIRQMCSQADSVLITNHGPCGSWVLVAWLCAHESAGGCAGHAICSLAPVTGSETEGMSYNDGGAWPIEEAFVCWSCCDMAAGPPYCVSGCMLLDATAGGIRTTWLWNVVRVAGNEHTALQFRHVRRRAARDSGGAV